MKMLLRNGSLLWQEGEVHILSGVLRVNPAPKTAQRATHLTWFACTPRQGDIPRRSASKSSFSEVTAVTSSPPNPTHQTLHPQPHINLSHLGETSNGQRGRYNSPLKETSHEGAHRKVRFHLHLNAQGIIQARISTVRKDTANWIALADYDIETARHTLTTQRYLYVIFLCHLAWRNCSKPM